MTRNTFFFAISPNFTHINDVNAFFLYWQQFNQHQSVKSTLSFNMRMWSQAKLDPIVDTANYTCTSTDNLVGNGVSSTTLFTVECKLKLIKFEWFLLIVNWYHSLHHYRCTNQHGYWPPNDRSGRRFDSRLFGVLGVCLSIGQLLLAIQPPDHWQWATSGTWLWTEPR